MVRQRGASQPAAPRPMRRSVGWIRVAYLEDMLDRGLLLEVERDHHNLPIIAHDLQHHAASHSAWLVKMTVQLGGISDTVTVYLEVPRVVLIASVWHNHLRTHPTEVVHSRPSEKSGGTEDGSLRRIAEQKGSKSNEGGQARGVSSRDWRRFQFT